MPRRILEGDVVSDKNHQTITVLVERRIMHPIYKKYLKKTRKFAAHDENNAFKVGDRVRIIESSPISKTKRWRVLENDGSESAPKGDKPKAAKAEKKEASPAAKTEKAPAKKDDAGKAEKKTTKAKAKK